MNPESKPAWESDLVWQFFDRRRDGFFLDIGANDPKDSSQTWLLEQQGWRGLLVEPQATLCERLRRERPRSRVFQAACGAPGHPPQLALHIAEEHSKSSLIPNAVDVDTRYARTEMVPVLTVDEVLRQAGDARPDFVSIDVEGAQLDVLRGFSLEQHPPSLLLVEDHLHNLKVHRYMVQHGYRLVKRTGLNNWYTPIHQPFTLSSPLEQMRLWKKVWLNTPIRMWRVRRERRRATAAGAGR
jgi:FkbM family methyltransferase